MIPNELIDISIDSLKKIAELFGVYAEVYKSSGDTDKSIMCGSIYYQILLVVEQMKKLQHDINNGEHTNIDA